MQRLALPPLRIVRIDLHAGSGAYQAGQSALDREALKALLTALNASAIALGRDDCGSWQILGKSGHVYTWAPGRRDFVLYVASGSARQWSADKKRLAFCTVTQDGDEEGCLRLPRLPTRSEADPIRRVLGIRKRTEWTAAGLEAQRQKLHAAQLVLETAGN